MSLIATAYAATEEGIKVSLSPYIVGELFGVPITATLLTAWLGMAILIAIAFFARRSLSLIPGRVQSVFELLIGGV